MFKIKTVILKRNDISSVARAAVPNKIKREIIFDE